MSLIHVSPQYLDVMDKLQKNEFVARYQFEEWYGKDFDIDKCIEFWREEIRSHFPEGKAPIEIYENRYEFRLINLTEWGRRA